MQLKESLMGHVEADGQELVEWEEVIESVVAPLLEAETIEVGSIVLGNVIEPLEEDLLDNSMEMDRLK